MKINLFEVNELKRLSQSVWKECKGRGKSDIPRSQIERFMKRQDQFLRDRTAVKELSASILKADQAVATLGTTTAPTILKINTGMGPVVVINKAAQQLLGTPPHLPFSRFDDGSGFYWEYIRERTVNNFCPDDPPPPPPVPVEAPDGVKVQQRDPGISERIMTTPVREVNWNAALKTFGYGLVTVVSAAVTVLAGIATLGTTIDPIPGDEVALGTGTAAMAGVTATSATIFYLSAKEFLKSFF